MSGTLQVSMLGSFTITRDGNTIDDSNNRMRKVWLLIAYLIYTRRKPVNQEALLALLESTNGDCEDPAGRLKALLYRARTLLHGLGNKSGHDLIIYKDNTYQWNAQIPLQLDTEEFDRLCVAAFSESGEARLSCFLQALVLYQGDFLPKLSTELWAIPIASYYHQRFLDAASETLVLLEERKRWQEAAALCNRALQIEPYSEELYQHLMRCQIATGDQAAALASYETMRSVLFDTFGVIPSEESRKLQREASREAETVSIPSDDVRDQLLENTDVHGAMYCEYDFFRFLYQVQARSIVRTGDTIHIALLTLHGVDRKILPRRSLDRAADNLQDLLLCNLRQGDVVTRCSASQLLVMLPQANYENSCAVCQRIIKAFNRQYPHSPAQIHFSVHPLEPAKPDRRS